MFRARLPSPFGLGAATSAGVATAGRTSSPPLPPPPPGAERSLTPANFSLTEVLLFEVASSSAHGAISMSRSVPCADQAASRARTTKKRTRKAAEEDAKIKHYDFFRGLISGKHIALENLEITLNIPVRRTPTKPDSSFSLRHTSNSSTVSGSTVMLAMATIPLGMASLCGREKEAMNSQSEYLGGNDWLNGGALSSTAASYVYAPRLRVTQPHLASFISA